MSLPTSLSQHIIRRPQRIALLAHIAEQGSITRAAKSAGLSYKAAWDAIDELNNLAQNPLVERSVGGKGGGGARLTAEGERVLRLYQRLQVLQAEVLGSDEAASDFNLLGRLMLRTSARNQLHGQVVAIERHGRNDLIRLQLAGGLSLSAQITHDSTQRLELEAGVEVVALIKAGWLEVCASQHPETPGHNCLIGQRRRHSRRRGRPQRSANRPAQRPGTLRPGPAPRAQGPGCRRRPADPGAIRAEQCIARHARLSAGPAAPAVKLQQFRHARSLWCLQKPQGA